MFIEQLRSARVSRSDNLTLAQPFKGNDILHSVTRQGSLVHWFESAKGAKCNSLGQRPRNPTC